MGGFAALGTLARVAGEILADPATSGIARWFLVAIFVVSGLAKVRHPALAALAMVDFGVARRVRPPLGLLVGLAELGLAAALALGIWAGPLVRPTAIVAAGVLWLFALLIARSLRAGDRFACFCFGESDDRLSALTLVRTAGLAFLATGLGLVDTTLTGSADAGATGVQLATALALLGAIVLGGHVPALWRMSGEEPGARRTVRA